MLDAVRNIIRIYMRTGTILAMISFVAMMVGYYFTSAPVDIFLLTYLGPTLASWLTGFSWVLIIVLAALFSIIVRVAWLPLIWVWILGWLL